MGEELGKSHWQVKQACPKLPAALALEVGLRHFKVARSNLNLQFCSSSLLSCPLIFLLCDLCYASVHLSAVLVV